MNSGKNCWQKKIDTRLDLFRSEASTMGNQEEFLKLQEETTVMN